MADSYELLKKLKACIDCYGVKYEVPKILSGIKKEIEQVEKEQVGIRAILSNAKIDDVDYKWAYVECVVELIDKENNLPKKYTTYYLNEYGYKFNEITFSPNWYKNICSPDKRQESYKRSFLNSVRDTFVAEERKNECGTRYKYVLELPLLYRKTYSDMCERAKAMVPQKAAEIRAIKSKDYENKTKNAQMLSLRMKRLDDEYSGFNDILKKADSNLEFLLSNIGIHPKYRELPCLCSIYEYLDTGRCNTLTGRDGAYQLYEEELVAGRIIGSLERIENSLNYISRNQQELAQTIIRCQANVVRELNSIQASVNSIQGTMQDIKTDTAAVKYDTERIKKITEFVNSVRYTKGEFSGFEHRYPY